MDIKSYIASQLNDEQTKAALHTDTSSLIIAGAGSWKTRVLTYKIAYLIRGKKIAPTRILAVTFTNKAAGEMRERLTKISNEIFEVEKLRGWEVEKSSKENTENSIDDFLQSIDTNQNTSTLPRFNSSTATKWIWTFHSIFLKILKEDIDKLGMKYNKNFWIFDTNESQSVIKDVLKRMNLQDVYKVAEVKWFISTQKNNGIEVKMFLSSSKSDYDQHMGQIYDEYQKALEKANSLDFDDLLPTCCLKKIRKHSPSDKRNLIIFLSMRRKTPIESNLNWWEWWPVAEQILPWSVTIFKVSMAEDEHWWKIFSM